MIERDLKPGWRRVKFGDVVRLSKARSKDPMADGIERYVGLEHLEPGDLRIRRWGNVADGVTFTSVFQPGQVLFGKRRAYQRKVAVADFSGVCSGDIYVLETKDAEVLLPELLPFICQTDAFFDHAVGTSAGSLSPRTNWKSLAEFEFELPPAGEQSRVVDLLTQCELLVDQIETAYESALTLHRAYLEELTIQIDPQANRSIIPLSGVCSHIVDCLHRTPQYQAEGLPAIRTTDIEDGLLKLDQAYRVSESEYEVQVSRLRPLPKDIVYSREAPMGHAALVPEDVRVCISQRVMHLRTKEEMNPTFLMEVLNSPYVRRQVEKFATGSTVKHINVADVKKLMIPSLPLERQNQIAKVLSELRAVTAAIRVRSTNAKLLKAQVLAEYTGVQSNV